MSKQTDLAYAAGIVDGEGMITITPGAKLAEGRRMGASLVRVTNTDVRMVAWLHDRYGGNVAAHEPTGRRRPFYTWTLSGPRVVPFLIAIRPYLVTKGEHADILLAFQRTKSYYRGRGGGRRLPDEVMSEREQLRGRIGKLNQRGRPQSVRLVG